MVQPGPSEKVSGVKAVITVLFAVSDSFGKVRSYYAATGKTISSF